MKNTVYILLATFLATQSAEAGKGVFFKINNNSSYDISLSASGKNWAFEIPNPARIPKGTHPVYSYYTEASSGGSQIMFSFTHPIRKDNKINYITSVCTYAWEDNKVLSQGCTNTTANNISISVGNNANCDSQVCVVLNIENK